ncbi:MAG: citrate synthase [Deltaproteobacteria bacterium]|nr:citrate synthase [Deltaproteobacteria bacterium]MBW2051804.1 citrate synthase [Deltaproteobacteria bacterium]MBW2139652.1 citrate synthase [Deltaproteobacteria bacterium]MBW2322149.1 citrate synthase [Deltaproteobacteria bacterium]
MGETAKLIIDGKSYELPIVTGSEGEKAIDITKLRQATGMVTMDPGFANTASCKSQITFVDGEKGILQYRGIQIEQLAEQSTFVETAYLLINGELPNQTELNRFSVLLNDHSLVHEDMRAFFEKFPRSAHPMGILSSMVNALRAFYPEIPERTEEEEVNITVTRLLSKVRTMAAISYKISRGHKLVYPRHDLSYPANFLNMMFDTPVRPYLIDEDLVSALNKFWIMHADHEQNCSTAALRLVGSAKANLYAAISAGICALWGPLHGGANQAVLEMLNQIYESGRGIAPFIARAKDRNDSFRLMGFGHRVYKTYDPRAKIMKEMCDRILNKMSINDPLLDIALNLEEAALKDQYFIDHNLYPNLDFYSGIFLRSLGIPTNMFTVMFAIGRLPGWISHWQESIEDPDWKIHRPRQIYNGLTKRDYIPLDKRRESN